MVIVQMWFDKRRSLASGLMMAGVGVGTFIWPPLLRLAIDTYTWRGAFYIAAGMVAQIFIFISLLRTPPDDHSNKQLENKRKKDDGKVNKKQNLAKKEKTLPENFERLSKSEQNLHDYQAHLSKHKQNDQEDCGDSSKAEQNGPDGYEELSKKEHRLCKDNNGLSKKEKLLQQDIDFSSNLEKRLHLKSLHELRENYKKHKPNLTLQYCIWIIYTLSLMMESMGHFAPLSYYPMKGHQEGIEKHKVPLLLSVYGAMATVWRPLAGYICDRFVNRLTIAVVANIICGLILIFSCLIHAFPPFLAAAIFLGIMQCK